MDETNSEALVASQSGCQQCANPNTEPGYHTQLCSDCRKQLSRYPVLNSVKLAAVGVGVLFLISLYNFPKYFKAGIAYEKAKQAEKSHHYLKEKQWLKQVLQQFPNNDNANIRYLMASIYNDNLTEADSILQIVRNKKIEDEQLVTQATAALETLHYFSVKDTAFNTVLDSMDNTTPAYEKALGTYYGQHPEDVCTGYLWGLYAYQHQNYPKADSVLSQITSIAPDFRLGLSLLANTYREEKEYDKALKTYRLILEQNADASYAQAGIAKILLKQHHDKEALEKAITAYNTDAENAINIHALALAYHFNNKPSERDKLYQKLQAIHAEADFLTELDDVMSGKNSYR
ncbi:tetratricopeptide repeat protein [Chitinophaga sp. 30R24]|uniref:tetratricopeptide repeat protein n=1 Tax=Chitinophaga sp. 30R24 TaxID=3248838 RepID=UPI003B90A67E